MNKHKIIFQILSFVLHPIFIPTFITLLYLYIFGDMLTPELSEYLLSLVLIGSLGLPLLTIIILIKTKIVSSVFLDQTKERIIPIVLTGIYIYITARLLMANNINSPLNSYLIGIVVTLSWILIFSRRMKISLHTASISSGLGFIIYLSSIFHINLSVAVIIMIMILGLISTARINLGAHNYKEIITGIVFGILPQMGFVYLN